MAEAVEIPSAITQGNSAGWTGYGAIAALGAALFAVCRFFPAELPAWMPWAFVWPEYLAAALALYWFGRGLARVDAADRGVRVRAAQHRHLEQARQIDVVDEPPAPGEQRRVLLALDARAEPLCAHLAGLLVGWVSGEAA